MDDLISRAEAIDALGHFNDYVYSIFTGGTR